MPEIKTFDFKDDIPFGSEFYYVGWPDIDLKNKQDNYQARYLGEVEDFRLKVIEDDLSEYFLICRSGKSFVNQRQFFLEESKCIAVINANGNIYRFDLFQKSFLECSCYKEIWFDNIENKEDISWYLKTEVSSDGKIMLVIDAQGVAAINSEKMLWKRKYDWAYADYLRIISVTDTSVVIESAAPWDNEIILLLNVLTGEDLRPIS